MTCEVTTAVMPGLWLRVSGDEDEIHQCEWVTRAHAAHGAPQWREPLHHWLGWWIGGGRGAPPPLPALQPVRGFSGTVLKRLARVPFGRTVTYGELARWVGQPAAARATAGACARNPFALLVPCHRVVRSDGGLGGYSGVGGLRTKRLLLSREGAWHAPTPRPTAPQPPHRHDGLPRGAPSGRSAR